MFGRKNRSDFEIRCEQNGFIIKSEQSVFIKWAEIDRIVARKVDLITEDEIVLDIYYQHGVWQVPESTKGFEAFIEAMEQKLPVNNEWFAEVQKPAFSETPTEVYSKG